MSTSITGSQFVATGATISNGTALSTAIDLDITRPFAFVLPAAWTAANLTFQVSLDGTTWCNLFDDAGTEVTVVALVSQYVVIANPAKWLGVRFLKIRSGTSGAAVNQGADRIVTVVAVP